MSSTSTATRPAGFSLLDVLNSVQGAPAAAPRATGHPTGAAWIPPAQRDLTVGPPQASPGSDPVAVMGASPQIADDLTFAAGGNNLRREGLELLRDLARAA